jgi:hypothetical protein
MCTNYNPNELAFTDKVSMMNYYFSNERKPSKTFMHAIECAPSQLSIEEFFVQTGPTVADSEKKWYYPGKFQLAVGGNPTSGGYLGDLWITYEVEFYQERLPKIIGNNQESSLFVGTTASGAAPFGTAGAFDPDSTLTVSIVNPNLLTIKNGQGKYFQISMFWKGTAAVAALFVPTIANGTLTYMSGSTVGFAPENAVSVTTLSWIAFVAVTDVETDCVITMSLGMTIPTAATVGVFICQTAPYVAPMLRKLCESACETRSKMNLSDLSDKEWAAFDRWRLLSGIKSENSWWKLLRKYEEEDKLHDLVQFLHPDDDSASEGVIERSRSCM